MPALLAFTASSIKALLKTALHKANTGLSAYPIGKLIKQTGSNLLNAANTACYGRKIVISIFIKLDYSGTHSP